MTDVGVWEPTGSKLEIGHIRELFYKDSSGWMYVGTYKVLKSAPLDLYIC